MITGRSDISRSSLSQRAESAYKESIHHFKKGDIRKAMSLIDISITIDPQHYPYYYNRSLYLSKLGFLMDSLVDSRIAYQLAIEAGSRDLRYHCHLAETQMKLNLHEDAGITLNNAMLFEGKMSADDMRINTSWLKKLNDLRRGLQETVKMLEKYSAASAEEYHVLNHMYSSKSETRTKSTENSSSSISHKMHTHKSPSVLVSNTPRSQVTAQSRISSLTHHSDSTNSKYLHQQTNNNHLPPLIDKTKTMFPKVYRVQNDHVYKNYKLDKAKEEEYIRQHNIAFNAAKNAAASLISFLGSVDTLTPEEEQDWRESQTYGGYLNTIHSELPLAEPSSILDPHPLPGEQFFSSECLAEREAGNNDSGTEIDLNVTSLPEVPAPVPDDGGDDSNTTSFARQLSQKEKRNVLGHKARDISDAEDSSEADSHPQLRRGTSRVVIFKEVAHPTDRRSKSTILCDGDDD